MSTLNEWIDDYCEENEIELPSGIPDEKTALCFLCLNKSEGGGGGGSSDFSIAEVIINNTGDETGMLFIPYYYDEIDEETQEEYYGTSGEVYSYPSESTTINLILYKGVGYISCLGDTIFTGATGNAEADGGYAMITGDCELTLVGAGFHNYRLIGELTVQAANVSSQFRIHAPGLSALAGIQQSYLVSTDDPITLKVYAPPYTSYAEIILTKHTAYPVKTELLDPANTAGITLSGNIVAESPTGTFKMTGDCSMTVDLTQ